MTAPTIKKGALVRVQFVPIVPKVPKYRSSQKKLDKARACLPEFWNSLSQSEQERFKAFKRSL